MNVSVIQCLLERQRECQCGCVSAFGYSAVRVFVCE